MFCNWDTHGLFLAFFDKFLDWRPDLTSRWYTNEVWLDSWLGFLNANGSPLTRGQVSNYGIMDQMAVLQWVQENIVQFGGDPQRVTLIGHGTGAACIEYLTHSPTTVPGKNANSLLLFPIKLGLNWKMGKIFCVCALEKKLGNYFFFARLKLWDRESTTGFDFHPREALENFW